MASLHSEVNTAVNKTHYDSVYSCVNISGILKKLEYLDAFLDDATTTDTSWVCMYRDDFKNSLKGKKVLELGCGDCTNAAVMAALGAEVWANDISSKSGEIVKALNANYAFKYPIRYLEGDFLKIPLPETTFDIVIGKAFVHHLTHEQEKAFLKRIVAILKQTGQVRYVEPAVNSKILDTLRWMIPVKGRPSSLQCAKFKAWKLADPHPDRNNSGRHYSRIGEKYFSHVKVYPLGILERFHRLFPNASWNRAFRRKAFIWERYLPHVIRYFGARTQTIEYRCPFQD
ncbi:class I SAM-dependent methyltransferase [Formosa sp. S-31]|uniref:class I SAM-dependent methyltransferase n=1 Tax=Formosa sp. S-31 TaxID=2790949 RepID=UPI003EBF8ED2